MGKKIMNHEGNINDPSTGVYTTLLFLSKTLFLGLETKAVIGGNLNSNAHCSSAKKALFNRKFVCELFHLALLPWETPFPEVQVDCEKSSRKNSVSDPTFGWDQVMIPLNTYQGQFPEMRKKIDKRGRKLIDFDKERHNVQQMQSNPNRNEAKFAR